MILTPGSKILQTVSVPHTGNRFWWDVLNRSRVVFGGSVLNREFDFAPLFAEPHRTVVFVRDPVRVEISFRNRGETSLFGKFYDIFAVANERTTFVRTDCPDSERDAEIAKLQAVVDQAMSEQAALGYEFKPLRHDLATSMAQRDEAFAGDWAINPDHSVKGDWTERYDAVLADLGSRFDLAPFRQLGYGV